MNKFTRLIGFLILMAGLAADVSAEETIYDPSRERQIPIKIYLPDIVCETTQCPVAFLSAGYGVSHLKYNFIANFFNQRGYLIISVGHELESDPPLSVRDDLFETRLENWNRGAVSLAFLVQYFKRLQKDESYLENYNFGNITLIGHSNGGDISSLFAIKHQNTVDTLITLDHRRYPLPRDTSIKVLSLRASDFPADDGVLYSENELALGFRCVTRLEKARHNDMVDWGPEWLKRSITSKIDDFLDGNCR